MMATSAVKMLEQNRTAERSVVEQAGFIELTLHRPGERGDNEPTWLAFGQILRVQTLSEYRRPASPDCGHCAHVHNVHGVNGLGCALCGCQHFKEVRPAGPVHSRLIFAGGADNYYCVDCKEQPEFVLALIAEARR